MSWDTQEILHVVALILLVAALLLVARIVYARLSGFDVDHQLTEADNPAIGTSLFGFMAGVVIALAGVIGTESLEVEDPDLAWDLAETAIYGVVSILLLKLSGWVNDRFILHNFENKKELVDDKNVGAGAVLAGTYIASGLVLAGALGGRIDPALISDDATHWDQLARGLASAGVFFALGQVVLVLYGQLYHRMSKHKPLDAIEQDYERHGVQHGGNEAAGIALGGNFAAMGIILWGATRGDFRGWDENLLRFAIVAALGLVLLPLWRLFVDKVLLGKADVAKEIYEDRNPNAALLETIVLVGLAAVIAVALGPGATPTS